MVESISIGAHPERAILGEAEATYFLQDSRVRIIEFEVQSSDRELPFGIPLVEVDIAHPCDASYPEMPVGIDDRPDASTDIAVALEGVGQLPLFRVVEEDPIVGPYPKPPIVLIISHCPDIVDEVRQFAGEFFLLHLCGLVKGDAVEPPTPCANPQTALVVRFEQ